MGIYRAAWWILWGVRSVTDDLKNGWIDYDTRKNIRHGQITAYTMCRVLRRTEDGWLVDCGNGRKEEISEAEAEKMEEVR